MQNSSSTRIPPSLAATSRLTARLSRIEDATVRWMRLHNVRLLRAGIGIVFVWFGAVKLIPGLSPAETLAQDLVASVAGFIDPDLFVRILAVWEVLIGLGMITAVYMRATLGLFFTHMAGSFLPLVLLPSETWQRFPFVLTLEGQFIIKNLTLVTAAMAIVGATRAGRTTARSLDGPPSSPPARA